MSIQDSQRITELERRVALLEAVLDLRIDRGKAALTQVADQQAGEVHKQVRETLKVPKRV